MLLATIALLFLMPFDLERAKPVFRFFEHVLKHGKGEFAGQPFRLCPWQREVIARIFGTVDERGNRQYQTAYVEVPKKNGKSELAAGIALYMLLMDGEPGAEVYSAASSKDQAGNVYRVAADMVRRSSLLRQFLTVIPSTKRIVKRDEPLSFYAAISADGDVQDGINPHCVIADELHRWKVAKALDLWEILERGTITRRQPLVFAITTAGVEDESPLCWRYHEYERQIRTGVFGDPHFYGRVWSAGKDDDWKSPEVWISANPSHEAHGQGKPDHGCFLRHAALEKEFRKALNDPAQIPEFKRFHLNIWGNHTEAVIDMPRWAENGGGYDLRKDPIGNDDLVHLWGLAERPCIAGVDLSSTIDLTALVLLFPPQDDETHYTILPFFWMPDARVRERELRDKVPYSQWIARGFVTACPGEAVDYRAIADKIRWASQLFELREVVLDPWNSRQLSMGLIDEGFTCIELRQGFQSLTAPTKQLLQLYLDRRLRHANNPVLYWNASCATLKSDGNDNIRFIKPDRAKESKRIDGMAALVNALSRAVEPAAGGSVYENAETALI